MEIRKLNALRGLAALMVVVSHYSNRTKLFGKILGDGSGQLGVMLFFILSGFLMSYLYLNKQFEKENVKNFIIARCARVLPLFFLVVVITYTIYQLTGTTIFYDIKTTEVLISHLFLFGPGTDILWTIIVEFHFYILFIGLWRLFSWKPIYAYICIAFLFIGVLILDFPVYNWKILNMPISFSLLLYLNYFLVGIIFGQVYQKLKTPNLLKKDVFILAFFLIIFLIPSVFHFLMGYDHKMWKDISVLIIFSSAFFCLIFLVPDNNRILSNKVTDFIGKISYSIYIFHMPILSKLVSLPTHPPKHQPEIFLFIFIALVVIAAYASYTFFELPTNKAIRAFFSRTDKVYKQPST